MAALAVCAPPDCRAARQSAPSASKYKKVKKNLSQARQELGKIEQSEKVTLREIQRVSRKLSKARAEHRKQKEKLDQTNSQIKDIRLEVAVKERKVGESMQWLRRKLRAMNRHGKYGDAILLLSSSRDVPEFTRRWKYLEKLAGHEQKAMDAYQSAIAELRNKKVKLSKARTRYEEQEKKLGAVAQKLEIEKNKKEKMLMSVRREKQTYSRIEWELKRESARIKKVIHQSAREKKKKYSGKGFRKGKGRLGWPVRGKVAVPFGKHNDPKTRTPVFRNGIYISAPENTVARAVDRGKIVFADWFEGYGQLVIVNHGGGYHTLYANLSEIFLATGDIIKKNDRVGRVGTSGIINKPALYFEIRYKGKPLNPALWLTR